MTEVGEAPNETSSAVEFSEEQKELIQRAMGEVDAVYDDHRAIKRGNEGYVENVRPLVRRTLSIAKQANPRENGYRQIDTAAGGELAGVKSALFRVQETLDKSVLPQSMKDVIRFELMGIVKDQQNAEGHREESESRFRKILVKMERNIDELQDERRRVGQRASENEERARTIKGSASSDLTERYFRLSRNLAEETSGRSSHLGRKEEEIRDENTARYSSFRNIVEDLTETVNRETEKETGD